MKVRTVNRLLVMVVFFVVPFGAVRAGEEKSSKHPCEGGLQSPVGESFLAEIPEGRLSAAALKDNVLIVKSRPLFSTWTAHRVAWQMRLRGLLSGRPQSESQYSPLGRDLWLDGPQSDRERYCRWEAEVRDLLGPEEFESLQRYVSEVRSLLVSQFPGELNRFDVTLRNFSWGVLRRGHRHHYPKSDFIEVSVARTEFGPTTVLADQDLGPSDVAWMTDAWHATPPSGDLRLFILITARFSSPEYEDYYKYNEYEF